MSTTVKQVYNNEIVQADWAVTDEGSLAFIKNKPNDLAKTDLSNIDNEVLKNKIEESGYAGNEIDLSEYVKKTGDTITGELIFKTDSAEDGVSIKAISDTSIGNHRLQIGNSDPNKPSDVIYLYSNQLCFGMNDNGFEPNLIISDMNGEVDIRSHFNDSMAMNDAYINFNSSGLFLKNTIHSNGINITQNEISVSYGNLRPVLEKPLIRNITISTNEPAASDGQNGDVWITYTK